jgi:hypothetical protein
MLACILGVLLSLGCVFFPFGMIVLAMGLSCGAMRLCSRLVMFCRLIVGVFHIDFLIVAETFRQDERTATIVAEWRAILVLTERSDFIVSYSE